MNKTHRQYLGEMGIDVWSLRTEKVDSPVELQSPKAEPTKAEPIKVVPVEAAASRAASVKAMPAKPKPERSTAQARKQAKVETPPAEIAIDSPRFFFCFLDYEKISLMLTLPDNVDALPPNYRQLCDDIVFALSGQRKVPIVRALRWPMVDAAHIQQTEADARLVIKDMIKQCGDHLIMFGRETSKYAEEKVQGTYLSVEDIKLYIAEPEKKRSLWQQLRSLKQAL